MSVHVVLKEISSVTAFFHSRGDSKDQSVLQKSFADGLLNKLSMIPNFSTGDGAQLHAALLDSPFGEVQTQRIRDALDSLVQQCSSKSTAPTSAGCTDGSKQLLRHWPNYFTAAKHEYLAGPHSFTAKMTVMVETGMSVGCTRPTEDTLRYCLAMLLALHYTTVPTPQEIYRKLQDLKQSWISEAKPWYLDHLQEFPENPMDLPKKVYDHAFPDAPPVSVSIQGINTIADSIPLRANSKLLKKGKGQSGSSSLEDAYASSKPPTPPMKQERPPIKQERDVPTVALKHELDVDSEDDADIILLKTEYSFKLAQLKASKQKQKDCQVEQPIAVKQEDHGGRITISRSSTGKLEVAAAGASESGGPGAAEVPPEATLSDLDPWTQQALNAMQSRNQGRAAARKTDEQQQQQQQTTQQQQGQPNGPIMKRPGAAPTSVGKKVKVKHEPKTKIKAEAKSKIKVEAKTKIKAEVDDEVPRSKIMAAIPKNTANAKPVRYWGGIIYTAAKAKKFRALKVRGDNYTEASASWGSDKPSKEAWRKCVKAIEDHHK